MNQEEIKKLEDLLKGAIRPLKELIEVLKSKVDHQELYLLATSSNVKSIKEQQSVINEKLDANSRILDEHGKILEGHGKMLVEQGRKLGILWDQVEKVTIGLEDVKETLDLHTAVFKRIEVKVDNNSDNTRKLSKRLIRVEGHLGIVPPPELTVAR